MYKHLKRRDVFEIVRECAVNSPAAKESFQRSSVDKNTRFSDLGLTSETDIIALCHEIERRIGYRANRKRVSGITANTSIREAVSIFYVDY